MNAVTSWIQGNKLLAGSGLLLLAITVVCRVVKKEKLLLWSLPWSGRFGRLFSTFLNGRLGEKAANRLEEGPISTIIFVLIENLRCFMRNMLSDNTNYAKVGKKTGTIIGSLLVAAVCFGFAGCSKKQTIVPDSIPQSEESFSVADPVPDEASLDTFPEPIEKVQIPVNHTHTVFFAFDSDKLSETEAINLRMWYNSVQPIESVPEVVGYACCIGTSDYNMDLGLRRAETVYNALKSMGHDYAQMRSVGESECFERPRNYDKCRKVVITYTHTLDRLGYAQ